MVCVSFENTFNGCIAVQGLETLLVCDTSENQSGFVTLHKVQYVHSLVSWGFNQFRKEEMVPFLEGDTPFMALCWVSESVIFREPSE